MRRNRLKIAAAFACLITLVLTALPGCAAEKESEEPPSLWVVTEKTKWDGMNAQAEEMIEVFRESHPEFTVTLDILPQEEEERSTYLGRIRTEMMAGKGPDVFLLPTTNTTTNCSDEFVRKLRNDASKISVSVREPLFPDVVQTMRNGQLLDLSAYYDQDDTIGKEFFNTAIMDAGTVSENSYRDGRYILPLRYNVPALFVNVDMLADYGLTLDDLDGNVLDLMDLAVSSGSHTLACSVEPQSLYFGRGFSFFSQVVDYEQGKVLLTKEEVAGLLRRFQLVEQLVGFEKDHRIKFQLYTLSVPGMFGFWPISEEYYTFPPANYQEMVQRTIMDPYKIFPYMLPMRQATLEDAVVLTALSQKSDTEYAIQPLYGTGDTLSAYVTYFGAIGAGCRYPQEAYEFLRLFLTEDAQYERSRPWMTDGYYIEVPFRFSLIEEGWPVRSVEGTNKVWKTLRTACRNLFTGGLVPLTLERIHLTDEDLPLLEVPIDHVYFGSALEQKFSKMARSLNDPKTGRPTDADIDAMAEEFIRELELQLLEG